MEVVVLIDPPVIPEDMVFSFVPFGMKRPEQVSQDGQAGITRKTYDILLDSIQTELQARMRSSKIPLERWGDPLVVQAGALMMAANICRKVGTYRDHADALFADANIKYRLFYSSVMGYDEGGGGYASAVVESVTELTDTQFGSSDPFLSVFDRVR